MGGVASDHWLCATNNRGGGSFELKCLNKFHMPGPGKVTAVDKSKI